MGLWLLSESVRAWESEGGQAGLKNLLAQAAEVTGTVSVFDTNDARFLAPGNMPARIAQYCTEHDLPVPASRAEMVRSILESLAAAFAEAVAAAQRLTGTDIRTVHLVGGGSQNILLCQLTANRTGLPVLAGPVEATVLGNVLIQARAEGFISGDSETLRALVTKTSRLTRYLPASY